MVVAPPQEKIQFLLASHSGDGIMAFEGQLGDSVQELVIKPGIEVAIDERWLLVPAFARTVKSPDNAKGTIALRRSEVVPEPIRPDVSLEFSLEPSQAHIVRRLCYEESIAPEVRSTVEIHKLIGESGIPSRDVRVNKKYLQADHMRLIRAALELERRYRNRKKIISWLQSVERAIGAM